ncbi:MAG: T9SS type A sorting domain-containing protein [Cytophagales bacterium]|nr:T9SS type A sorting domain-containing protein [Cytophagales bacterium]
MNHELINFATNTTALDADTIVHTVNFYPNPASSKDGSKIVISSPMNETATVDIISALGVKVASYSLKLNIGTNTMSIGAGLSSGMYTVTVTTPQGIKTLKLAITE